MKCASPLAPPSTRTVFSPASPMIVCRQPCTQAQAQSCNLQCETGPFLMCTSMCVALCSGFHRSRGFSHAALRKSIVRRRHVASSPPVLRHLHTSRVRGGNRPGSGPLCNGCEGPAQSAGGGMQWKVFFYKRTAARQHHSELRRTERTPGCTTHTARCGSVLLRRETTTEPNSGLLSVHNGLFYRLEIIKV